jgi:integration host factor subunit beta
MIKSELIQLISSKQHHLSENDVIAAVTMLINKMIDELASGGRIEIRGFGAFSLKHRRAKMGRNPRTGVAVSVPQKHSVYFKPGTELRERVNDSASQYNINKD